MKIKIIIPLILVTLASTILLSGCTNPNENSSSNTTNVYTSDNKIVDKNNTEDKINDSNLNKESDISKEGTSSKDLVNNLNRYEIVTKTYHKNSVEINYPQVKNFSNEERLKAINKDLEEEALSILKNYFEDDPNINEVTMDINYEVKLRNNNYISIVYTGYSNVTGAAYPVSVFYTTNIDIEKGSSIRLLDYADVNDVLNKLKDPNVVTVLSDNKELVEAQRSILENYDSKELLSMLKEADFYKSNEKLESPPNGVYSYMDDGNIVISLEVNHAMGDHAEFAVKK
ncbi:DUF4163 domain-containing protein [Clostridium uliginosum]|uniref:Deacetylase PdaC domain-containing protein n=1 Tax=Clostridium uliginosum TaxID=119641 RepID=A0A1I1NE72_9CLOT|nr:DUF4163 domain-containing protein [Clostridium uliginosum]SFC93758.1 protein of unknown function [Clostridium uliginosum]